MKGVEDLMKQTEFISVKCDEHLKTLEESSAGMTGMTILHAGYVYIVIICTYSADLI